MHEEEPGLGGPLGPFEVLRKFVPFEAAATSEGLGWMGLEAARYVAAPSSELNVPASTHHWLVLVTRPPDELELQYKGVKRYVPLRAGSISLVPAGSPALWRWSGARTHCTSTWNQGWSRELPPKHSTSTQRG